jgi:LysR family glycine cleavage system transcriptional activator
MALKKLPSVASLKGFEACARLLNFSQAAGELHVTQSAISHQIRQLEESLGVTLFDRSAGAMTLSENGAALLPVVRSFFQGMSTIVEKFENNDRQKTVLEVFVHDSFATTWLLPRLAGFYARWPHIDIKISTVEFSRFDNPATQVAIRIAPKGSAWPGLHSVFVMAEQIFPVCSPSLVETYGLPTCAADIMRYPLIFRVRNRLNGEVVDTPSWDNWLKRTNVPLTPLNRTLSVPYTAMAVLAAMRGLGVAMARTSHIADEFETGKLQKLWNEEVDTNSGYYFLCTPGKEKTPEIEAFFDWLQEQIALQKVER